MNKLPTLDWFSEECFIGNTYNAYWREELEAVCDELLPQYGLKPWYAYKYFDPANPMLRDKVVEMIAHARYGIYDLSYWRENDTSPWQMPRNVLIELGIAIALNRPTLLLRNRENCEYGIELPEVFKNITQICEYSGERTLRTTLEARLPYWVTRSPEQEWRNRYCLFGTLSCSFREIHPLAVMTADGKLSCHIADGSDVDKEDFLDNIESVLKRFDKVTIKYLDKTFIPTGYAFLLCAACQFIRSTHFAIYRITPHTSAGTFIAIGISMALEYQFGYKIPKLIITTNERQLPSLLAGYEFIPYSRKADFKSHLASAVQQVIEKINRTTWKPQSLPFEVFIPQKDVHLIQKENSLAENTPEGLQVISYYNYDEYILPAGSQVLVNDKEQVMEEMVIALIPGKDREPIPISARRPGEAQINVKGNLLIYIKKEQVASTSNDNIIYKRLRNERLRRGWSQDEMAERIGVSVSSVSNWENGKRLPQPYYRQKICEIFGITLEELGLPVKYFTNEGDSGDVSANTQGNKGSAKTNTTASSGIIPTKKPMVNEEEVLKLVDHDRIDTDPLHEFFDVGVLDESTLSSSDSFFNLGAISGHTHAAPGGSFVTPIETTESFDLFKIQDEEPMDSLDPSKEPPIGWKPGPEDVPHSFQGDSSTYPGKLTRRELEVLRLITAGMANSQIADKLVISPRTVTAHMSSIYDKLGLSSRSAVIHYALENHLV